MVSECLSWATNLTGRPPAIRSRALPS
ncbi:MAG: hypothetical protein V7605_1941, partial [Acidimicrobiaceae bacterium]